MKNIPATIVIITISLFTFSACDKAKVNVDFNVDVNSVNFIIDTTSTTGNVNFSSTQFNAQIQQRLADHDASLDDVKSIELTKVEFVHLNPQNFDIVDRAYAFLSSGSLPEIRIASKDPVPNGVTSFELDLENTTMMKEYLANDPITFRAYGYLNSPNTQVDSLRANLSFKVHAEVKP